jgi:glycerol-3-phosphate dehydrogenase
MYLRYGTCALQVAELAQNGYGKKLAHGSNVLEAEVVYAIQREFAVTATDFIARRSRLAFLSSEMATQVRMGGDT